MHIFHKWRYGKRYEVNMVRKGYDPNGYEISSQPYIQTRQDRTCLVCGKLEVKVISKGSG